MNYLVFDVESDGLYGRAFAWGGVIVDKKGKILEECIKICGIHIQTEWVKENVLPSLNTLSCYEPSHYSEWLNSFWSFRETWKDAIMVADVPYPVETNFLAKVFGDGSKYGPYPLLDVASIRFAKGLDPLQEETRLEDELPKHNPLCDAKQSARLFIEAMNF